MSKRQFVPILIGSADFANGTAYRIEQVNKGGGCKVIDLMTQNVSFAGSMAKAWSSVRFMARVNDRTHNTSGWRG